MANAAFQSFVGAADAMANLVRTKMSNQLFAESMPLELERMRMDVERQRALQPIMLEQARVNHDFFLDEAAFKRDSWGLETAARRNEIAARHMDSTRSIADSMAQVNLRQRENEARFEMRQRANSLLGGILGAHTDQVTGRGGGFAGGTLSGEHMADYVIGAGLEAPSGRPRSMYPDGAQLSIGYGTVYKGGPTTLTHEQARERLVDEMDEHLGYVNRAIDDMGANLSTQQKAALTDISFNAGPAFMRKALKAYQEGGEAGFIAAVKGRRVMAGSRLEKGLRNRRDAEVSLFTGGDVPIGEASGRSRDEAEGDFAGELERIETGMNAPEPRIPTIIPRADVVIRPGESMEDFEVRRAAVPDLVARPGETPEQLEERRQEPRRLAIEASAAKTEATQRAGDVAKRVDELMKFVEHVGGPDALLKADPALFMQIDRVLDMVKEQPGVQDIVDKRRGKRLLRDFNSAAAIYAPLIEPDEADRIRGELESGRINNREQLAEAFQTSVTAREARIKLGMNSMEVQRESLAKFDAVIRGNKILQAADVLVQPIKSFYTQMEDQNRRTPATGMMDLGLIQTFAKILDPGSVVRESDVQLQQGTVGIWERAKISFEKALKGRMLDATQRAEMLQVVKAIEASLPRAKATELAKLRRDAINVYGVDPRRFATLTEGMQTETGEQQAPQTAVNKEGVTVNVPANVQPFALNFGGETLHGFIDASRNLYTSGRMMAPGQINKFDHNGDIRAFRWDGSNLIPVTGR